MLVAFARPTSEFHTSVCKNYSPNACQAQESLQRKSPRLHMHVTKHKLEILHSKINKHWHAQKSYKNIQKALYISWFQIIILLRGAV